MTEEAEWRGKVSADLEHIQDELKTSRLEFQSFVATGRQQHAEQAAALGEALLKIEKLFGELKAVTLRIASHEDLDIRSFNRLWWVLGLTPAAAGVGLTVYALWGS